MGVLGWQTKRVGWIGKPTIVLSNCPSPRLRRVRKGGCQRRERGFQEQRAASPGRPQVAWCAAAGPRAGSGRAGGGGGGPWGSEVAAAAAAAVEAPGA